MPNDLGTEGLRYEMRAEWKVVRPSLRSARGDHDRDMRPVLGGVTREGKTITFARHVYVAEQQCDAGVMLLEESQRRISVTRFHDLEPGILQDAGSVHADEAIIVDDQGA